MTLADTKPVDPVVASNSNGLEGWRDEVRTYLHEMQSFDRNTPDQTFMKLAAYTARASEIRSLTFDLDTRANTAFRTKHLDPFIDECERQFRYWSRVVTVQQTEIDLAGRVM